jgi:tetratricopeptide (TPR) repeat protein
MKLLKPLLGLSFILLLTYTVSAQTKPATPAKPGTAPAKPAGTPPTANKNELVQRANDLMESNRYEEAALMLNDAIKIDPNDAELHYKLGNCFTNNGKFKEAVAPLQKAVTLKKNYSEAYEQLGRVYIELKNIKEGINAFDMAFKNEQDPAQKLTYKLEILDILFSMNKYGMAKGHLYDAKTLPDGLGESFDVKFKEAQYLNLSGKYEEALKILQVIIDDEVQAVEGNEQYFYELGVAYHMLGRYKEADIEFNKANNGEYKAKIRRYAPETYYEVASTYYNIWDYETAEKYLNIVMAIKPDFVDVQKLRQNLAALKADQKLLIKALEDQNKKEKDKIALAKNYEDLSFYYFKAGNYQLAEINIDECMKIREFDMKLTFLKAMSEYKLKQPAQGADLLVRASKNPKLSPEEKARLSFVLGLLYRSGDNLNEAFKSFKISSVGTFKSASLIQIEEITRIKQGLGQDDDLVVDEGDDEVKE